DGQVFNRKELADWLGGKHHRLRGDDACELLLHLYEEEGAAGWRRGDGQFALALWDSRKRRGFPARGFLGGGALFYWASPGGVGFVAEIKALPRHPGVPCAVDGVGVSHSLTFLNVPGPRTLFAGIAKLPAGTVAAATADGAVSTEKYWDLLQD